MHQHACMKVDVAGGEPAWQVAHVARQCYTPIPRSQSCEPNGCRKEKCPLGAMNFQCKCAIAATARQTHYACRCAGANEGGGEHVVYTPFQRLYLRLQLVANIKAGTRHALLAAWLLAANVRAQSAAYPFWGSSATYFVALSAGARQSGCSVNERGRASAQLAPELSKLGGLCVMQQYCALSGVPCAIFLLKIPLKWIALDAEMPSRIWCARLGGRVSCLLRPVPCVPDDCCWLAGGGRCSWNLSFVTRNIPAFRCYCVQAACSVPMQYLCSVPMQRTPSRRPTGSTTTWRGGDGRGVGLPSLSKHSARGVVVLKTVVVLSCKRVLLVHTAHIRCSMHGRCDPCMMRHRKGNSSASGCGEWVLKNGASVHGQKVHTHARMYTKVVQQELGMNRIKDAGAGRETLTVTHTWWWCDDRL